MSRRAAIYCRGKAVRANRAAEQALRRVASREGWTLAGTFVDEAGPSKPQYDRVWRGITARDIDMVAVPSLAALADGVSGVLAEILRLRDAGCDLYVLDPNLNTQSPVDRILFSIVEALKSVDDVSKRQPPPEGRRKRAPARKFTPTPGQREHLARTAVPTHRHRVIDAAAILDVADPVEAPPVQRPPDLTRPQLVLAPAEAEVAEPTWSSRSKSAR